MIIEARTLAHGRKVFMDVEVLRYERTPKDTDNFDSLGYYTQLEWTVRKWSMHEPKTGRKMMWGKCDVPYPIDITDEEISDLITERLQPTETQA